MSPRFFKNNSIFITLQYLDLLNLRKSAQYANCAIGNCKLGLRNPETAQTGTAQKATTP